MHLILLGILILLVALIGYSLLVGNRQPGRHNKRQTYEPMVRCQHCGVHLPKSRALGDEKHGYHCADHEND